MEENGMNDGAQATAGTETNTNTNAGAGNVAPAAQAQSVGEHYGIEERSAFSDNAEQASASWTDALPDELKNNPHLRGFKSANDALKSYASLCSMAGKKGLMAPPEGASQAELDAYLTTRRGGISAPTEYSLPFKQVEAFGVTEEAYRHMNEEFFKAGLSDREQREVMRTLANLREYETANWIRENNANCERALIEAKHAWGMDYESKLESVKQLMKSFPEAKQALESAGAQNNFAVLDMLATFAGASREQGAPKQDGVAIDAKSLDKQIDALVNSDAYKDPDSAGHQAAMNQFWDLMDRRSSGRR